MTAIGKVRGVPARRNDPAGMRGRILDSAFELFQSHGYAASSIQQIASHAKVTSGALHHHFATKKSIGLSVVEERVRPALESTWLEPIETSITPEDGILEVFNQLARALDAQGSVRGCPVNNLAVELAFSDEEFRRALAGLFERWLSTLRRRLNEYDDPGALATMIVAGYSGAMTLAKVEQNGEPLRICANEIAKLLQSSKQRRTAQIRSSQ